MLVECGFTRATTGDGQEFTFRPSFGRIAALGSPHEIVSLFAALHDPAKAQETATYVLACLCDQDDPTPLIGWRDEAGRHDGLMPAGEQVIIAQHLMRHGIAGKAKPGTKDGKYSASFEAAEYISAARVHLGQSREDAEALSMTEFQSMLEMKFPDAGKSRDVPSREEYAASMKAIKERRGG